MLVGTVDFVIPVHISAQKEFFHFVKVDDLTSFRGYDATDLVKFICRELSAKQILTKLVRRCIIVLWSPHDLLVCREVSESFIGN